MELEREKCEKLLKVLKKSEKGGKIKKLIKKWQVSKTSKFNNFVLHDAERFRYYK